MAHSHRAFRERFLDYLLQVSLIVLGLVIATGADRCNANRQEDRRLQQYYQAILQDLQDEQRVTAMNIGDARNDVGQLEYAITKLALADPDSTLAGLDTLRWVLQKGVFRTFNPTTFDVMVNTGDVSLIDDLSLRSDLAAVFAFRTNIVRPDLEAYNSQTVRTIEQLATLTDLNCLLQDVGYREVCRPIDAATATRGKNVLISLLLQAKSRLFHLEMLQESVGEMVTRLTPLA